MQRVKIIMGQRNYINIGYTHIFFDFNKENLDYISGIHHQSVRKIHIFITNHYSINNHLKNLMYRFNDKKIIVHIPKGQDKIKELFTNINRGDNRYRLINNGRDVIFSGDAGKCPYRISILYRKDSLNVKMRNDASPYTIRFPSYTYNKVEEEGAFGSADERLNPEMFKDKIIAKFRENIPEKMKHLFKDDEEVWKYIMKPQEFGERIKRR